MSPGSGRKKPICQKCGYQMVGHKRPYGTPVCPTDNPEAVQKHFPSPPSVSTLDVSGPSSTTCKGTSPDFTFNPTASGYWHRSNPNWDRHLQSSPPNPFKDVPSRLDASGSWISTERDSTARDSPAHARAIPSPPVRSRQTEVINVDAEVEEDDEEEEEDEDDVAAAEMDAYDTQSDLSNSSSRTILQRVGRTLSFAIGRGTPIASLYTAPRDQVTSITSAATAEGLHTRVMHLRSESVKPEPVTPSRTTPAREYSWMVAVGRDPIAINALVDSHTSPRHRALLSTPEEIAPEPYDYDRGLCRERNERVGTFPEDARWIRSTFLDLVTAGAVGGLVVFYCLSAL